MTTLPVDRDAIAAFVDTLFRYADEGTYVQLRAFVDRANGPPWGTWQAVKLNGAGPGEVVDAAVPFAQQCADAAEPVVFCPPIVGLNSPTEAAEKNIANGLVLTVDCDKNPAAARIFLERLLGPASVVIASGGEWVSPTGEVEPRLHLHWRLMEVTREKEEHHRLKEARRLAQRLVGADSSAVPLVHPLRWPGSVHRKAEPRLARIVALNESAEIDLGDALELLREAVTARGEDASEADEKTHKTSEPEADFFDIAAALEAIPNPDLEWSSWNKIALAVWRATGGSDAGRELFAEWSAKSKKKDIPANTRGRWDEISKSPPSKIGFGSLHYWARQARPGWRKPSEMADADSKKRAFAAACRARRESKTFAEMVEALRNDPNLVEWVVEKGEPDDGRELKRVWEAAGAAVAVTLNDFRAYMPMHTYIYAPTRAMWPSNSVNARIGPIDIGDGEEIAASTWLDVNRPVEQMTWAPGLPEIIENRLLYEGGWINRSGARCFNLYLPPAIIPGDAQRADHWVNHVRLIYPNEAEHLLDWQAHRVQRPQEKINHALVLGGEQGIGKDTILEPVKRAIGPWNFQEASPLQVLGRFNGFLKCVILRISEARDLGEFDRVKFYDHMKAYNAAPPDTLRVDEKNLREYPILNVCGVIVTTNYKTNGIYLPTDDRRHFVAWSDLNREDECFAGDYWDRLYGYFADGGNEAVAAYLVQRDLRAFNPKAPPPKTEAFWAVADNYRPAEESELADTLDLMGRPSAFTLAMLIHAAVTRPGGTDAGFIDWLRDRKNRRTIPLRLEKCGYVPVRNPNVIDGQWVIQGRRQTIYAAKNLSPRDQIAAAQKL